MQSTRTKPHPTKEISRTIRSNTVPLYLADSNGDRPRQLDHFYRQQHPSARSDAEMGRPKRLENQTIMNIRRNCWGLKIPLPTPSK